jgi:hypothetical protein
VNSNACKLVVDQYGLPYTPPHVECHTYPTRCLYTKRNQFSPLSLKLLLSPWFLFNRTTVSLTRLHTFTILYNSRDCFQLASSTYTPHPSTPPLGPSTYNSRLRMADPILPPIDTSASTSTAPAPTSNGTGTQSNPAAPTASGSVPPSATAPPRPQGGMTDDQKREMVKAFTPEKIASFKKVSRIKQWWSNADDRCWLI